MKKCQEEIVCQICFPHYIAGGLFGYQRDPVSIHPEGLKQYFRNTWCRGREDSMESRDGGSKGGKEQKSKVSVQIGQSRDGRYKETDRQTDKKRRGEKDVHSVPGDGAAPTVSNPQAEHDDPVPREARRKDTRGGSRPQEQEQDRRTKREKEKNIVVGGKNERDLWRMQRKNERGRKDIEEKENQDEGRRK